VAESSSASFRQLCNIQPHLILAADVVYDPALFDALCQVIRCALLGTAEADAQGSGERFALIASTMRNKETYSLFLQAIREDQRSAVHSKLTLTDVPVCLSAALWPPLLTCRSIWSLGKRGDLDGAQDRLANWAAFPGRPRCRYRSVSFEPFCRSRRDCATDQSVCLMYNHVYTTCKEKM
jgi:hypothetical protein